MTEILVIIAIALAIFMLPRLTGRHAQNERAPSPGLSRISGWLRLAILGAILWLAGTAFFLKPWNSGWPIFFYIGLGPVFLFWGLYWVLSGFRK